MRRVPPEESLTIAPRKRIAQDSQTRYEPSVEFFAERGTIHADDEMDKEHREDYEVIVKKEVDPECPECGNSSRQVDREVDDGADADRWLWRSRRHWARVSFYPPFSALASAGSTSRTFPTIP
jgi:hypothetical protein